MKKQTKRLKESAQLLNVSMTQNQVPCRITRSSSAAANAILKSNAMKRKSPLDDLHDKDKEEKKKKTEISDNSAKDSPNDKGEKNCDDTLQSSDCFCGICFEFKPKTDMFQGEQCNHPFCNDCISKYVAAQIQQNVLKVNCPNPNCHVELESKYLEPILPKEVMDRWESAKRESTDIIASSLRFYCPFKDCSVMLVNGGDDDGEIVTSFLCTSCQRLVCVQCKVPWHANMNCEEFERSKCEEDMDRKFLELARSEEWQKCPRCAFVVQRKSGCNHIVCRLCYVSIPAFSN
ncbi:hypothetical protein RIF29_03615 [Crotalaria pallida]|uniref:RBR-type E3 ubiquitin transferase n=1 Tax=Crotalaria pallida TaxID=3830 RepID=A0AAN9J155_CROPI